MNNKSKRKVMKTVMITIGILFILTGFSLFVKGLFLEKTYMEVDCMQSSSKEILINGTTHCYVNKVDELTAIGFFMIFMGFITSAFLSTLLPDILFAEPITKRVD